MSSQPPQRFEATATSGVGLTVTADSFFGGPATFQAPIEVGSGLIFGGNFYTGVTNNNSPEISAPTNLTLITAAGAETIAENVVGAALSTTTDVDLNGVNAGVITATTSLEATAAAGVGLTVTSDAYIGGNVTVVGDLEANDVNTTSDVTKRREHPRDW